MSALSLRPRLTLWYTLALLLALGLFGINLLLILREIFLRNSNLCLHLLPLILVLLRARPCRSGTLFPLCRNKSHLWRWLPLWFLRRRRRRR